MTHDEIEKTKEERHLRSAMLLGQDGIAQLQQAHVAVFGVGGVGGHCAEALARSGVGALTLIDRDQVTWSNMNRQLVATVDAIGRSKVDAMAERLRQSAPDCQVYPLPLFFLPDTAEQVPFARFTWAVDCMDNITAKVALAVTCQTLGIPLISAMGAGNRLDPTAFRVGDLAETTCCPLARTMRKVLRKHEIHHLPVVYSTEPARAIVPGDQYPPRTPGSVSFVPGVMGMILASAVVRGILGIS